MARCVVRAPLPYTLRFDVHVDEVVPGELVAAHVEGDIAGPARLEIEPDAHADGSHARLVWSVDLRAPLLRRFAVVGRPVMEWGHEWVVTNGVRQFRQRVLEV